MRIIAGEFRGRQLLAPQGDTTRPITDRAKQSLFDILTPVIAEANVYDIFSGTGSLGLESLSRGAKFASFFEIDRSAIARLSQNLAALQVSDRARVVPGDVFRWFDLSVRRPDSTNASGADLVFLDPPYRFLRQHSDEILQLALNLTHSHLQPTSVVVFRHDGRDKLPLPNLERFDVREFGDMTIELLKPVAQEHQEAIS
ncbi:MAG TPA: 16S rRNA (guanine(966)-N(2))-methyltransferase RsmD [Tepidisphaeraceae bacterium]|nr:16S rRNA (guanine(966)-N(2))-methyltransferase RsmD [Tepidisphaeraceae bacterium]